MSDQTSEAGIDAGGEIEILLLGGDDVVQFVEPVERGGRATPGLAALIATTTARTAQIELRRVDRLSEMIAAIDDGGVPAGGVVITSVASALHEAADKDDVEDWYLSVMADVVTRVREGGAHLLVANGSTYDPEQTIFNYANQPDPPALSLHRLDLALIQLSVLDGISIIDADRVVAEIGGDQAVDGLMSYREPAATALCEETVRILGEYRFFEAGHLVPQSGRRKA